MSEVKTRERLLDSAEQLFAEKGISSTSLRALTRAAGLPVLGSVSLIVSPAMRSARLRSTIAWFGANVALVMATVVVIVLSDSVSGVMRDLVESVL